MKRDWAFPLTGLEVTRTDAFNPALRAARLQANWQGIGEKRSETALDLYSINTCLIM